MNQLSQSSPNKSKSNKQNLSLTAQITRQLNRVEYLERHLREFSEECPKIVNRAGMKTIKKLIVKNCIEQNKLRSLKRDLEEERKNGKTLVISERMEMFFKIIQGLRPRTSKEIGLLLVK